MVDSCGFFPLTLSFLCSCSHLVRGSNLPWQQAICQVDYHPTTIVIFDNRSGTVEYLKRRGSHLSPALRFLRVFQRRGPDWQGDLIWPYRLSAVSK